MSETIFFDEDGVRITPGAMTVREKFGRHGNERVKVFSLNDVTEIRCVTRKESPFNTFFDRVMREWLPMLIFIGILLVKVPHDTVIFNVNTRDLFSTIGILLTICGIFRVLWHLFPAFSVFANRNKYKWAVWAGVLAAYYGSFMLARWSFTLSLIALGLCFSGTVFCAWFANDLDVVSWVNIELLHGKKATVCYQMIAWVGGVNRRPGETESNFKEIVERRDERYAKSKQIMDALRTAMGAR